MDPNENFNSTESCTMKTKQSYYLILFVYISLWSCEVIACHLTHSLIILVDSYINLYKILDISLGILHLKTQLQVRNLTNQSDETAKKNGQHNSLASKVFNQTCTYKFKRLPILGSFVNGLFLAALLMSAAIEGIQTCFHASHSTDGKKSILLENPITYPGILVGFGVIGIIMRWSSSLVHVMREEELDSESLLDITKKLAGSLQELDVQKFNSSNSRLDGTSSEEAKGSILYVEEPQDLMVKFSSCHKNRRSYELVAKQSSQNDQTQISLKSLKINSSTDSLPPGNDNLRADNIIALNSISNEVADKQSSRVELITTKESATKTKDKWYYVRYCASPFALTACALVVYFIHNELVTEIADVTAALSVVVLLFTASYPPMKKASKILLQGVPEGVDLTKLETSLRSVSNLIVDIKDIHVWSLTSKSNRVGTCNLIFNQTILETKQLAKILNEARLKFLDQNIKCCTIQPSFIEEKREQESQN